MVSEAAETVTVRAGDLPKSRAIGYGGIGFAVAMAIWGVSLALFGFDGSGAGAVLGAIIGAGLVWALVMTDTAILNDAAVVRRTLWSRTSIGWDQVVSARFTRATDQHWTFALELTHQTNATDELVLLRIPAVTKPMSGAADLHARDTLTAIRTLLRSKQVSISIDPKIAAALQEHWSIAPPTSS